MPVNAPFPYSGGKGRWAAEIWKRFGTPWGYFEPFFGSGAVLLHREVPCTREIVCDTNSHICNFYRALRADPDQVAYWSDWPTIHDDLTARRTYLLKWKAEHSHRVKEDMDFYDARVAGLWCWGMAHWIGGSRFPDSKGDGGGDGIPHVKNIASGRGVSAQRHEVPGGGGDQIPRVCSETGGNGVSAQRQTLGNIIPQVSASHGGRGVSMQRTTVPHTPGVLDGSRLRPWMHALAVRLQRVTVLNRPWTSICHSERTILGQSGDEPWPSVAILIDPPYLTDDRTDVYDAAHDGKADADAATRDSYAWAVEHGGRFRIAYCCHAGDFPLPDGWVSSITTFKGVRRADRHAEKLDEVMFSPACINADPPLFALLGD